MLTLKIMAVVSGGSMLAALAGIPEWVQVGIAIGAVWVRIEHRITKLETTIKDKLK